MAGIRAHPATPGASLADVVDPVEGEVDRPVRGLARGLRRGTGRGSCRARGRCRSSSLAPPGCHGRSLVRFEGRAHRAVGVVEAGSNGPGRDAEGLGDLGRLEPEVVVEDEDRPLVVGEAAERTFQLVAVRQRGDVVEPCGTVHREHADRGRLPRPTARLRVALVDEELRRPRDEAVRVSEVRELAPRADQGLLERVLRQPRIAQDPLGDRVQPVAVRRARMANASRSPCCAA